MQKEHQKKASETPSKTKNVLSQVLNQEEYQGDVVVTGRPFIPPSAAVYQSYRSEVDLWCYWPDGDEESHPAC